ncbi:AEC family transporter [Alkalihalobacillus sp. NPDC078783]
MGINQLVFAMSIIVLGLVIGGMLRVMAEKQYTPSWFPLSAFLFYCIRVVLLGMNPIILVGAFWSAELTDGNLVFLPLLGVLTIVLGGLLGILLSKMFSLNKPQTGAMFVTGSFINLGTFGSLFCVMLLGEKSLAYVAMFRLFEELFYYTVCYPVAKRYGVSQNEGRYRGWRSIIRDPFIMVTFLSIVIGGMLNVSGLERIDGYGQMIQILVPLTAILLLIPVGFSMRIKSVRKHLLLSVSLSLVKGLLVPLLVVSAALALGLGSIYDGYIVQVILILCMMPTAVSALVPPQLYRLDVDLANSNWLVNTCLLVIYIPLLYVVIPLI